MAWAPNYITDAELKSELKIAADDATDDLWVGVCATGASRAIDRHTNRQFGQVAVAETRVYRATYRCERGRWVAAIDDLMSSVSLAVDVDGEAVVGAVLEPRNAAAEGRPWTRLALNPDSSVVPATPDYLINVTERWGWSTVPGTVRAACFLQASRFYARRDSPYGVAGSPDMGNELRLLAKLDPDVAVMLADYGRTKAPA